MLRLSKKTDYALMAMKHLALLGDRGSSSAREIAEQYDIPVELMAKVLQRLARRKLLQSHQGTRGGYELARYWHFLFVWVFVAFTLLHVLLVLLVDRASLRAMITGWYAGRFPSHD